VGFASLAGVRWILFIACLAGAAHAGTPTQSNPAFLGIGFQNGPGGCIIENVVRGGAAWDAGMQLGDLVVAIDTFPLDAKSPCDQLVTMITAHAPGDKIRLDIARNAVPMVLTPILMTRAEVLQHRIGPRMDTVEVIDADDAHRRYNLGEPTGRTQVVGFYLPACSGCSRMFERVADGLRKRALGAPFLLGVTPNPIREDVAMIRKNFAPGVPLALADSDTFDAFAMTDPERVFFIVIDCRGIIRIVAPIAPESDDVDAAVDEVLAAVEQAEHARVSRR
jgi:PDZ domain-containing protein